MTTHVKHEVQRDNPTMRLIGFADDICQNVND